MCGILESRLAPNAGGVDFTCLLVHLTAVFAAAVSGLVEHCGAYIGGEQTPTGMCKSPLSLCGRSEDTSQHLQGT